MKIALKKLSPLNFAFWIGLALVFVVLLTHTSFFRRNPIPVAQNGVLDLRSWDFQRNDGIHLNGEWEFYWRQLLTPMDFAKDGVGSLQSTGMIRVPGSWWRYPLNEGRLNAIGFATYRLQVLVPENSPELGLNLPQFYTAYKLWVNGQLVSSGGKVGKTLENTVPQYIQRVVSCRPKNGRLELVVQVSNFHHHRCGIMRPIQLGLNERTKQANTLQEAFGLMIMGSFLLMALYNLSLYFSLKQGKAPLFLSAFFGIGVLRLTLVGPNFYTRVFPDFSWEWAMRLEYFTFYFCGPVFYRMIRRLYPEEIPQGMINFITGSGIIFAVITILTPARVYTYLAPIFQAILLGTVTYMGIVLGRVSIKRREYLMISVFAIIFFSLFNDILFYYNLVQAEFPMIPMIDNYKNLPFWPWRIPTGFISMVYFIFVFNILTLKMTQYYFTKTGLKTESETAVAVLNDYNLTPRETELVALLIQGLSNKEIADKLSIAEGTVKVHLHNLYEKTGTGNRTELSHLMRK